MQKRLPELGNRFNDGSFLEATVLREDVELGVLVRRQDFFHLRFLCDGGVVAHLHPFPNIGSGVDPLPTIVVGDNHKVAVVLLPEMLRSLLGELPDVPVPPGHLGSGLLEQALGGGDQAFRHIDERLDAVEAIEDELRTELNFDHSIAFGGGAPFIGLLLLLIELVNRKGFTSHVVDAGDDALGFGVGEFKTDLHLKTLLSPGYSRAK